MGLTRSRPSLEILSGDSADVYFTRAAGILAKEKATLWINHDKAQRDRLQMAPGFYE